MRMSFGVSPLPFCRYTLAPLHFRQVSVRTYIGIIFQSSLVVEQNPRIYRASRSLVHRGFDEDFTGSCYWSILLAWAKWQL